MGGQQISVYITDDVRDLVLGRARRINRSFSWVLRELVIAGAKSLGCYNIQQPWQETKGEPGALDNG